MGREMRKKKDSTIAPAMYLVRIQPSGRIAQHWLSETVAAAYVGAFNRVSRVSGAYAEMDEEVSGQRRSFVPLR